MVPRSTAERLLDIRDAATGLRDIVADMDTAFNATDPLSPILIVGLLAPIIGQSALSLGGEAALLFGMFAAATTWWVCLSGGIATAAIAAVWCPEPCNPGSAPPVRSRSRQRRSSGNADSVSAPFRGEAPRALR
jgi:hypothetical protein